MSSIPGSDTVSLELSSKEIAATEEDASVIFDTSQNIGSPKGVALRTAFIKNGGEGSVPLFRAHQMTVVVANFGGVVLVEETGEVLEIGNVATGAEEGAGT